MVKLRLARFGKKRNAFYRIVAVDSKARRDGQYIELVGTYDPIKGEVKINDQVAMKWLSLGAQPTDTVRNILSHAGVMTRFHNENNNSGLHVNAKDGKSFGAAVDHSNRFTAPGTGKKSKEVAEEIVAEVVAEAIEEAKEEIAAE